MTPKRYILTCDGITLEVQEPRLSRPEGGAHYWIGTVDFRLGLIVVKETVQRSTAAEAKAATFDQAIYLCREFEIEVPHCLERTRWAKE